MNARDKKKLEFLKEKYRGKVIIKCYRMTPEQHLHVLQAIDEMMEEVMPIWAITHKSREREVQRRVVSGQTPEAAARSVERELLSMSRSWQDHPNDYDGPCDCWECRTTG